MRIIALAHRSANRAQGPRDERPAATADSHTRTPAAPGRWSLWSQQIRHDFELDGEPCDVSAGEPALRPPPLIRPVPRASRHLSWSVPASIERSLGLGVGRDRTLASSLTILRLRSQAVQRAIVSESRADPPQKQDGRRVADMGRLGGAAVAPDGIP